MSWPCEMRCVQDHFCDLVTKTCMHCVIVCDPKYDTAGECKNECPNFQFVPPTTRPTELIESSTQSRESHNGMSTIYIILILLIIIVFVFCCILVVVAISQKNSQRGLWSFFGNCPNQASIEEGAGAGYCCNCCNRLRHSTSAICQTPTTNPVAVYEEETAFCSPVRITNKPLEEEKVAFISPRPPEGDLKLDITLPPVGTMDTGKQSYSVMDNFSTQKHRKAPMKMIGSERALDDGGFSASRASAGGKPSSLLVRDSTTDESYCTGNLSLELLSDEEQSPRYQPSVHAAVASADHWESVMRVYDIIDQHLHELSWVAGCMISNTALKITVKSEPTPENKRALKQRLRNVVPRDIPSERFALTFEGPALQTMAGPFGSGNMVSVSREGRREGRSTVTIFGRCSKGNGRVYLPQTYTFTVGHVAHEGSLCQVKASGEEDGGLISGHCLAHMDTVQDSYVTDIKHKIYDLALIEMDHGCSLVNSRRFLRNGREFTLKIELSKGDVKPVDLKPGREVLIFGGPKNRTIEAIVDAKPCYTCAEHCTGQLRPKQTVNLIQLSTSKPGETVFVPGHSGSLVAWSPFPGVTPGADGSVVVEAFAVIVGVNAKAPEKGFAVPLWEQMRQLFRKDAKFTYFNEYLYFDDYIEESGFYTNV